MSELGKAKNEAIGSGELSDDDEDDGVIRLPKFDGTRSFRAFLKQFDIFAEYFKWSEEDKKTHLVEALEGDAVTTVIVCGTDATFEQLWQHLQQQYDGETQRQQARDELSTYRQGESQTLRELAYNIQTLSARGYPELTAKQRDDCFDRRAFLNALTDDALRLQVALQLPIKRWMKL